MPTVYKTTTGYRLTADNESIEVTISNSLYDFIQAQNQDQGNLWNHQPKL